MDQLELEKSLCEFIKENLIADTIDLKPDTLLADIGMDSFSTIEVVLFIERKFGIQLPDDVLTPSNIASVASLSKCTIDYANQVI